jgi:beta-lactamase superfamily II metal-dependent hydrolase
LSFWFFGLKKAGDLSLWQDKNWHKNYLAENNNDCHVLGSQAESQKTNEDSIVLMVDYMDFKVILTGDITSREEKQIVNDFYFSDIEVLNRFNFLNMKILRTDQNQAILTY